MKKILFLLVAAVFLFAACSDSSSDSTVTLPSGGNLNGTWGSECGDDGGEGAIQAITFESGGGSFTYDVWFGDTKCADTSSLTYAGTFSYTLGDSVTLKSGDDVTQLTTIDTGATATPNDADTVTLFNDNKAYGLTGWEIGVAQDVFGVDTDGSADTAKEQKDIVFVDETVTPNELSFGDETSIGKDGYPTKVGSNPLTKQ